MLEIPEAISISKQLNETIKGKKNKKRYRKFLKS